MSKRFLRLAILTAAIGSFVAIPAVPALAQGGNNPNTNRLEVPVTGAVQKDGVPAGNFAGTFSISRFAIQEERLVAIGQLTGAVTDPTGNVGSTMVTNIAMPVANASGSPAVEPLASCDTELLLP